MSEWCLLSVPMDDGRREHLQMIQGVIDRMAKRSFRNGPADFSMDVAAFKNSAPSLPTAAASPTILGFYGPVILAIVVLAFALPR